MSNDLPDFLSDDPSATPQVQPAPEPVTEAAPAAEAPAPEAGQPRDTNGRFAPATPEAPPAAPAAEAPPAQPQPPAEPYAPIAALLDEREKRQKAEARAAELEQWRQQQEAQARQQPPVRAPDPDQDPQGFRAFQAAQLDELLYEQRREMSRGFAEVRFGKDTVDQAFEWGAKRCDEDPYFNAKVRSSRDPYSFVVGEYQRDQIASQVSPDQFKAFQEWQAAQAAAASAPPAAAPPMAPAPVAAPPPAPAAPRPSLAAAPSAAASSQPIPRDGASTYDAMFDR
jgi:hypothetical protein